MVSVKVKPRQASILSFVLIVFIVLFLATFILNLFLPLPLVPVFTIYLPPILITTPTTELVVAIAEVVVAFGIVAGIVVGFLPFLSRKGASTIRS